MRSGDYLLLLCWGDRVVVRDGGANDRQRDVVDVAERRDLGVGCNDGVHVQEPLLEPLDLMHGPFLDCAGHVSGAEATGLGLR